VDITRIDMNTHDKVPAGHHGRSAASPPALAKRAYDPPRVMELGDVRELTRSGGGSVSDARSGSMGKKP
jgi:hypothetical protein